MKAPPAPLGVFDSGIGGLTVARALERLDLLANSGSHEHRFVVSDDEPHFRKVGALFLGEQLKQVEVVPL